MEHVSLPEVGRLFAYAERVTALLERCRPENARQEEARLLVCWKAGRAVVPEWRHRPVPDLGPVRAVLCEVAQRLSGHGPYAELLSARAEELDAEAQIVEAIGTPIFRDKAAARFPDEGGPHGARAARCADEWLGLREPPPGDRVPADDGRDPRSLLSAIRCLVGRHRLPVRVEARPDLASAAATGEGLIVIRSGVQHGPDAARRIAVHEVLGHALPRHRATRERSVLFSTGSARGQDDEEGRALLLEEEHGLFDEVRRRELSVRHRVAIAVRRGADWVEAMRLALSLGVTEEEAVPLCARVLRGGGLAREIVYLPARERVREALTGDPTLADWLASGRLAVDAAKRLRTRPHLAANVAATGV